MRGGSMTLTPKQHQAHSFICHRIAASGIAPSYEEVKAHLGLSSRSGVHALLNSLEERGYLRRQKHKARALEILRTPDGRPSGAVIAAIEGLVAAADAVANHGAALGVLKDALVRYRNRAGYMV